MANFPFWTNTRPGVYGPTDTYTSFHHKQTELIVHMDRLELIGEPKDAALALAKEVLGDGLRSGGIATAWNDVLRVVHGRGEYTLQYLREDKPPFFDELKEQFERICKLRAFT